ncbi:MAG TPA: diguanylate cyclase [Solirubrobacteraceae bacterium]|nr:diguanylate cyclase [Solirubrobacteraceae bacterium]
MARDAPSRSLEDAHDVRAACRALADHLAGLPGVLPSVYVEHGGRLRCQAIRGYWQTRDGIPPSSGVIGRAFSTGEEVLVEDVRAAPDYVEAIPGVVAEIAVPVRYEGRVVGVVNVESRAPLAPDAVDDIRGGAAALGRRIAELGGEPGESDAQRLVHHAAAMAALEDPDEIVEQLLTSALDVVALDSAILLTVDTAGALTVRAATGPLAEVLRGADERALRTVVDWVAAGASSFTAGDPGDEGPRGMDGLRAAGVASLGALHVDVPDAARGVLVMAGRSHVVLSTDRVELLELLAAHVSSCLRTAEALRATRERAAQDPLTGLGHHAAFYEALAGSHRRPRTAVLLCDVDGFKALNDHFGHQHGDQVLRDVAVALGGALRRGDRLFRIGGDEFAALLAVGSDDEALEAGERLRAAVAAADLGLTVSIGVAVPYDGEADAALVGRADRALYGVKAEGRDGVALA